MDERSVRKSLKKTAGATRTQWVCSTWLFLLVHKGHNSHSCLTYALYPAQKAIQYVWMSKPGKNGVPSYCCYAQIGQLQLRGESRVFKKALFCTALFKAESTFHRKRGRM